jgi:hypothetical protein
MQKFNLHDLINFELKASGEAYCRDTLSKNKEFRNIRGTKELN